MEKVSSLVLVAFLIGGPSCFMLKPTVAKNPGVPEASLQAARPATAVAVIDCRDDAQGASRNRTGRKLFESSVVPALWKGIGGTGAPRHERAAGDVELVCEDVLRNLYGLGEWKLTSGSKRWVEQVAAGGAKSVMFATYRFPQSCSRSAKTIRDSAGAVAGSIDGEEKCSESGFTMIGIVWVSPEGTVLGKVEERCDDWGQSKCGNNYQDADRAVADLMTLLGPEKRP
jgi:hypothetical protein